MENMLEVRDLHKYYGAFHAVRGISFDVARGEILGFLGPNGAGKTTTMKIAVGFMTMSSGSIMVDNHDVVQDSMAVRRIIGYLPEHAPLYEDMTVNEYLSFIADVRGLRGKERAERMEYVIGVCALQTKRKSGIKTLSKGYRQRVGLAQAIIHDPKLVILDEPTVGLDPNQIIEIRNLIHEIGVKNTVVLSSHILGEVEATCSRVVIINEGAIVANGTAAQLETELGESPTMHVGLGAPVETVKPVFEALPLVKSVTSAAATDTGSHFSLELNEHEGAAQSIVNLAQSKGWDLHELVRPKRTLEDVFKSLTVPGAAATTAKVNAPTEDSANDNSDDGVDA
ncbi:MAG: ABC-2 type transport system ATP-binding protein [Planctomycetota bacterium]|jgi:ABC-2 type transport system ATP-binding protein